MLTAAESVIPATVEEARFLRMLEDNGYFQVRRLPDGTYAALFRLRERDFEEVRHAGGVSPAWPLSYADFAPWYDEAEALFHVHGRRGEDPLDPGTTAYPFVPVMA